MTCVPPVATLIDIIPNVIAGGADVGAIVFVIVYASYSNWRLTPPGRSLMYAMTSLAALLLMNTIHLAVAPYPGVQFVRIAVYSALAFSIWRLVLALVEILRGGNPITVETFVTHKEQK